MQHVPVSDPPPYDHNKPLTCAHCIAILWEKRDALCEKYGWSEWPDDLMGPYERPVQ